MGSAESRDIDADERDRLCGQCSDAAVYQQSFCAKRPQTRLTRISDIHHPSRMPSTSPNSYHSPAVEESPITSLESAQTDLAAEDPSGSPYFSQPEPPDSWRFHAHSEEAVGVGAYFGRLEGQKDSVARVKSLVSGGPAEQTGMIEVQLFPSISLDIDGQTRAGLLCSRAPVRAFQQP
jgi:hypothetical protein